MRTAACFSFLLMTLLIVYGCARTSISSEPSITAPIPPMESDDWSTIGRDHHTPRTRLSPEEPVVKSTPETSIDSAINSTQKALDVLDKKRPQS